MSVKPQSITALAEVWDDLTPIQQQFMIQRAKGLAGYNKMKDKGVQFKPLYCCTVLTHETTEQTEPEKISKRQSLRRASSQRLSDK